MSAFQLRSPGFTADGTIPQKNTCEGAGLSPELRWDGAPADTKSFALVMHDPDTSHGDVTHWTVWNLPAGQTVLAEGAGSTVAGASGVNEHGEVKYLPPTPPKGDAPHHYIFNLYALDVATLDLPRGSKRIPAEEAIRAHAIATANLIGMFGRP